MKIFVTGGTGVIGSFLARELLEMGHRPVLFSRSVDTALIKDILVQLDILRGDVLDYPRLVESLKDSGAERIVHLAAMVIPQAQSNPVLGAKINVEGTLNVLEAARLTGAERVVFTSTKGVYGPMSGEYAYPTYRPITEDHPKKPVTVYDSTKLLCEQMGLEYSNKYGLDFIAMRFALMYGPARLSRHGPVAVHSRIIENAMLGRPLRIKRGGDEKDDLLYLKDCTSSIAKACFAQGLKHRVFHVGTGVGTSLRDTLKVIKELFGEVDIEIGGGLDFLGMGIPYYSVFDISRAKEELGFTPKYRLEDGIKDYIETMEHLGLKPFAT